MILIPPSSSPQSKLLRIAGATEYNLEVYASMYPGGAAASLFLATTFTSPAMDLPFGTLGFGTVTGYVYVYVYVGVCGCRESRMNTMPTPWNPDSWSCS